MRRSLKYLVTTPRRTLNLGFWRQLLVEIDRLLTLIRVDATVRGRRALAAVWVRLLLAERSGQGRPAMRVRWTGPSGRLSALVGDLSELRALSEIFVDQPYAAHGIGEVRTIVDLGANAGLSVLYFKARWPGARVLAVEPNPKTFERLVANTRHLRDVQCVQAAVAAEEGPITLYTGAESWASALTPSDQRAEAHVVRGVTLDALALEYGLDHVDLMKVDIEGSEGSALPAARSLDGVGRLIFEFHRDQAGLTIWELVAAIPGFDLVRITGDTEGQALVDMVASR